MVQESPPEKEEPPERMPGVLPVNEPNYDRLRAYKGTLSVTDLIYEMGVQMELWPDERG